MATRFTVRTVRHKNGKETEKPVYRYSDRILAAAWVVRQRELAEQRGILAAAKGLRTLGYPLSLALLVLLGTEEQAIEEALREQCF